MKWILLVTCLLAGCKDRDRREGPPGMVTAKLPAEPGCPAGAELLGAGMWCQRRAGGQLEVLRLDGTLWARGAVDERGLQGPITFYAPDGKIAMVRNYRDNNTDGDADVRIPGIELPPTILPVCLRDMTIAPTTTPCP
ncbi:MAG: hypothetical protein H0T89_01840 [Deltaproteobacteria bacterium]|nr:hypothetical protein [Deltaproteobacteria bacterium]MDQ3300598.1 hypothetical protein [Myxococcota bacterium]